MLSAVFVSVAATIAPAAQAQPVGFHRVGIAPEGGGTRVYSLSASGAFAAGTANLPGSRSFAFAWSVDAGRDEFGRSNGPVLSTSASAISGDASTAVGTTTSRAFVYHGPGTYQEIAPTAGYASTSASGVSGDGSIVAGIVSIPQTLSFQAFRWTSLGGVQLLGMARPGDGYSNASSISRDGSTIAGASGGGSNPAVACVWRQGSGVSILPSLPGSTSSGALGVNFDGSIVVGQSGPSGHAAMWRNGQVTDLGVPQGFLGSTISVGVNDLGTVVVGYTSSSTTRAFIWTPTFGMEYLSDYLARNGIQVPSDWTLLNATAVSADGLTIAGWGSNATTGSEGFVVTIPAPGSLVLVGAGTLLAAWRRRV